MSNTPKVVIIPVVVEEVQHHPDCPRYEGNERKSGPSSVVTDDYRRGWDKIFGNKPVVGEA